MSKQKLFTVSAVLILAMAQLSFAGFLNSFPKRSDSQINLTVNMGNPILEEKKRQTTEIKIGLTGFKIQNSDRAPINLALVLDKSGSMSGDKIEQAKEAALLVVDMLSSEDIFSLIVYSSTVHTLVPATKLTDKESIKRKIRSIRSNGSTALFGGVSKGLSEIDTFLDMERVNRIILLSDGLANIGPSSPYELGRLGISAGKKGVAVTTIGLGLGYNEDLMTQLAMNSDGNHAFVENSENLVSIFNKELGDVLSVVAQDVSITITCSNGIKPIKVIDREADIRGQEVTINLNQIYSEQEKYIILEVEIPEGKKGIDKNVADVKISYNNMKSKRQDIINKSTKVAFTDSRRVVEKNVDKDVKIKSVKARANVRSKKAIMFRDKGNVKEAEILLQQNVVDFASGASAYGSVELEEAVEESKKEVKQVKDDREWKKSRKSFKKKQYKTSNQTSY